jgi:hypothetical protein
MNFVEAIEFKTFVNGRAMTASVVEVDENPIQYSFRIQFSDGYEDTFTLDEGMIEAGNGDASKPYIRAIRNDIENVIGLDTGKFYYVLPERIDGITTNVWIIEREDEKNKTYYGVYYNGHYRFELRKIAEEWSYTSRSKEPGAKIDEALARKAIQILYSIV